MEQAREWSTKDIQAPLLGNLKQKSSSFPTSLNGADQFDWGPSIEYVRFRGGGGGTTKSVFLCTGVGEWSQQ